MNQLKAYILDRFARKKRLYTSWIDSSPIPCVVVEEFAPDWEVPDDAAIIVTHMHYRWEEISALRRIVEEGRVPVLILADGLLEFRNTWENPGVADGAVFQPIVGHKLACIGRGQARIIESWGNFGKCEVVGIPRIDPILDSEFSPINSEGDFRLLIATANTPAFNEQQRQSVLQSLLDLKEFLDQNPTFSGRSIEVQWRLTDGLDKEIKVNLDADPRKKPAPLEDVIGQVDAVITSPSTLFFESVLKQRPTAILDYSNCPQFVQSAWTISAASQVPTVIEDLSNPPPAKMLFQQTELHDQLECATPARLRLFALMKTMVRAGIEARDNQTPIRFATRVLSDPQRGIPVIETDFDRKAIYPDNSVFQNQEVELLQSELCQAIKRLEQLPRDLDVKDQNITAKNVDLDLKAKHIQKMEGLLEESRAIALDWKEQVVELRGQLNEKDNHLTNHINETEVAFSNYKDVIEKKNSHIQRLEEQLKNSVANGKRLNANLNETLERVAELHTFKQDVLKQRRIEEHRLEQERLAQERLAQEQATMGQTGHQETTESD